MVNNINISRYKGVVPAAMGADRVIPCGPLYQPEEVLLFLAEKGSEGLIAWTRKCKDALQKYAMDTEDVLAWVISCLHSGQFLGSEGCKQNPNGPWAACDAYRVVVRQWVKAAHKEMDFE